MRAESRHQNDLEDSGLSHPGSSQSGICRMNLFLTCDTHSIESARGRSSKVLSGDQIPLTANQIVKREMVRSTEPLCSAGHPQETDGRKRDRGYQRVGGVTERSLGEDFGRFWTTRTPPTLIPRRRTYRSFFEMRY